MVKGDRENGSVEKAEDLDQEGSRIDDHDVSLIFIHIIQDGLRELGKIKSSISSLRHIEGGHEETLNETQNGKEDDVKVQIAFGDKSTTERQNDQNQSKTQARRKDQTDKIESLLDVDAIVASGTAEGDGCNQEENIPE